MAMVQLEGLGKLKKFNDLIQTRNHDLPACSIMPQPSMLPCALLQKSTTKLLIPIFEDDLDETC
jgi:hypothetical protein